MLFGNENIPVLAYHLTGEFYKSFSSISSAGRELNINTGNIRRCLDGKVKRTGEFMFRSHNENGIFEDKIPPYGRSRKRNEEKPIVKTRSRKKDKALLKQILLYSLEGKLIKISSKHEVIKTLNVTENVIDAACKQKIKRVGEYQLRKYKDENYPLRINSYS